MGGDFKSAYVTASVGGAFKSAYVTASVPVNWFQAVMGEC